MSQWRAIPMLLSGGLFVVLVAIAWERVPAWWASDPVDFWTGFAHRLGRVDRLQPALLAVCLGSAIGFASSTGGAARACSAGRRRLPGRAGWLGGRAGPDPAAAGRLRVATAIGRRGVASPVVWRSPVRTVVALACFALAAWFVDPHRNWIGLLQFQEPVR